MVSVTFLSLLFFLHRFVDTFITPSRSPPLTLYLSLLFFRSSLSMLCSVSLSILETRDDRNFSRVLGNRFTAFQCRVLSFPPPSVSWTTVRQGQTFDNPMVLREDDRINFETINSDYPWGVVPNGQIVFSNVEYSDSLVYRCTATNEASGQMGTWTRILRVRGEFVCVVCVWVWVCTCICVYMYM